MPSLKKLHAFLNKFVEVAQVGPQYMWETAQLSAFIGSQ